MNKEQKEILLKEREHLKESVGRNPILIVIGFVLVFIAIIFGYTNGIIIFSVELILGIILIIFGMRDKEKSKIKEIDYLLAGDKAKKVKTFHKTRKFFCANCDTEVKETDNRCKKCKRHLLIDEAIKIRDIEIETNGFS